MHRSPAASSRSVNASAPADTRIYAVGDIHGRADLLSEIIARIDDDIRRRPIAHAIEIYLGDYVDRGPHSKTVIDLLTVRLVANRAVCLRGNHEAVMEGFLQDPAILQYWLQLGGMQTLASYGVELHNGTETANDLHRRFLDAFPRTHELFMQCLRTQFSCGDFLFVHAGIRPDVPIEHQDANDLIWIRDAFLNSTRNHGRFVVHGHTPVAHSDIRHNRINIDTAAWRTGTLTCIAIEGSTILFL
ncbi:metallophosphoesterase family protein [Bradyrhizobium australiense]|uniref:Serine/threonine protein phosphatase n=1 Tax=Bradyrhizobium australiense TaxID=2721161 RepID=A0A7Y4LXJ5_9BRAD|nr:metallophosphoesterase family protein [Bradyrhizobium australiense]NOJ42572.1 serine/threonine protein phosphatase [Bradyrhizobium australiense]